MDKERKEKNSLQLDFIHYNILRGKILYNFFKYPRLTYFHGGPVLLKGIITGSLSAKLKAPIILHSPEGMFAIAFPPHARGE